MSSRAGLLNSEHERNQERTVTRLNGLLNKVRELERELERHKEEEREITEQLQASAQDLQVNFHQQNYRVIGSYLVTIIYDKFWLFIINCVHGVLCHLGQTAPQREHFPQPDQGPWGQSRLPEWHRHRWAQGSNIGIGICHRYHWLRGSSSRIQSGHDAGWCPRTTEEKAHHSRLDWCRSCWGERCCVCFLN